MHSNLCLPVRVTLLNKSFKILDDVITKNEILAFVASFKRTDVAVSPFLSIHSCGTVRNSWVACASGKA